MERDGVILVARGASKFMADMAGATKSYQQFLSTTGQAPGVKGATQALGAFSAQQDKVTATTSKATGILGKFFKGFGLGAAQGMGLNSVLAALTGGIGAVGAIAGQVVVGGLKKLISGFKKLTDGVTRFIIESTKLSGRANELRLVTQLIGQRAGFSAEQVSEYTKSVIEAGIRSDIAQNLIAQMARAQLNLADASKLARVAQDAAILSMSDSSETLQRIQYGIQTYQTEVLRTAGLNVNIQKSFQDLAKTLGLSTSQALSETQKQQAVLNAVLEEGARIAGTYELAMKSPAKALRSLPRYFYEIKAAVGAPFQQAFGTVVATITKLTKAVLAAVQEGGVLYPLLMNLGVAASFLADGFAAAADVILPAVERMAGGVNDRMTGLIERAFDWGAEIIIQLSEGIIQATESVLDQAIQFVGNMLTGWLAPGSPPKVAPKLREWGIGWMAELLGGMTEADFGILKGLQGPLKSLFEGPDFAKLSKTISANLAADNVEGVLKALTESDKDFGPQLAELAKREFALADAVGAVVKAQEDLEAAQKRALAVQGEVSTETAKYNELLRAGADPSALDAQLARINAAEEERRVALAAEEAAKKNLELREGGEAEAKKEAAAYQEIIDQLLMYNDALTEQERQLLGRAPRGKGMPPRRPGVPGGAVGGLDIGGAIGAAIDAAKEKIKQKFRDLLGSIRDVWERGLARLREKWDGFVEKLGLAWGNLKEKYPILQDIEDWVVGLPEKIRSMISTGWDKFMGALDSIWSFITTYISPLFIVLKDILIEGVKTKVLDLAMAWFGEGGLLEGLEAVKNFWDIHFQPFLEEAWPKALAELKATYIDPLTQSIDFLKGALESATTWLGNLLEKARTANLEKLKWLVGRSPSPLAIGAQTAADAIERLATVSIPKMNSALSYRQPMAGGASFRPASHTTQQSNRFAFNTNVNSGMDQAMFEAAVMRVIRRAVAEAT